MYIHIYISQLFSESEKNMNLNDTVHIQTHDPYYMQQENHTDAIFEYIYLWIL